MAPSSRVTTIPTPLTPNTSDGDGAPESFTLSESKKHAKLFNGIRQTAESDAERRRKERNRRRDENWKMRALETRGDNGKRKGSPLKREGRREEEPRNPEARMKRAMQEADEEESDGDGSWTGFADDQDVETGVESDQESDTSDQSSGESGSTSDESMDGVEEISGTESGSDVEHPNDPKRDYLPDRLFAEALSKTTTQTKKGISLSRRPLKAKSNKRRKLASKRNAKGIILGSKTICTHSPKTSHTSSAVSRTLPPGKIKRFYESHLNLRSNRASSRERRNLWDRRAANIGVLRSSTLPATHFARNS